MRVFKQIVKFGIAGIIVAAIDFSLLYIFTEYCGLWYFLSAILSFVASVTVNYIISMKFVFVGKKHRSKKQEYMIFVALSVIGLVINESGMWLMVEIGGLYYMLSKSIVTVIVMVYNYITRKLFVEGKET